MAVYFIRAGHDGPVKIGRSFAPGERLAALQTSSASDLILLREIEGGERVERWLHRQFGTRRIRGEWFEFDEKMLSTETPPALADDDAKDPPGRGVTTDEIDLRIFDGCITELRAELGEPDEAAISKMLAERARRGRDRAVANAKRALEIAENAAEVGRVAHAKIMTDRARALKNLAELWHAKYLEQGGDGLLVARNSGRSNTSGLEASR